MKNKKNFFLALILLTIPFATHAFSWRSLAVWEKTKQAIEIQKPKELTASEKKAAYDKATLWGETFHDKKWTKLIKNQNNFQFSDVELNYLVNDLLNKDTAAPTKDINFIFANNKITITGHLLKPIAGNFELVASIKSTDNKLIPVFEKIRFKGFPVPKFITNKIIDKTFPEAISFLYTYPNYKGLDVQIESGSLKLNYK